MKAKLICYTLGEVTPTTRNLFKRELNGYKDVSNNGKYSYVRKGLLQKLPHLMPIRSVIIIANKKDLPVDPLKDSPKIKKCPKCNSQEFIPEKDILDTWATSSLTPQIAASLVPELYHKLYPMDLRPNAHDIITFWLFNTLAKSYLHNKVLPWKDAIISGWQLRLLFWTILRIMFESIGESIYRLIIFFAIGRDKC